MLSFVAGFDPEYLAQILWAPDRRSARISAEGIRRFLLSGCPAARIEAALPQFTAEPVDPYETPLSFNEFDGPRYYVECLRDRVVPIALQRSMHADLPSDRVYSLESGHAPYLSTPDELALILHGIAKIC